MEKLSALRNSPLASEPLISTLAIASGKLPPNINGFRLVLSRFSDTSGINLRFNFTAGGTPPPDAIVHFNVYGDAEKAKWVIGQLIVIEDVSAHPDKSPSAWTKPEAWQKLAKAIDVASAAPDTAFVIVASFSIDKETTLY
jgi:hypothetical protein